MKQQDPTTVVLSVFLVFILLVAMVVGALVPSDNEVDKVWVAERYVKSVVLNYPDTANFHTLSTNVSGNDVALTVTAKNAFGVPSTHKFIVEVEGTTVLSCTKIE